jgi:predicted nucleic acid-binding protein
VGLTVLDAGVIIGVLDASDAHHVMARDALAAAVERGDTLVVPASAYAECLVGPARRGESAVQRVNDFLFDVTAEVEPITRQVAAQAAQLRARHGSTLRLPDALVVALAVHLKADRLLTTDRGWPSVGVRVDLVGS